MKIITCAFVALTVFGIELTSDNWDDKTVGKTVFIKFVASWCELCKNMKPAWDKLMTEFEDNKTILVADVDCTADGEKLCEEEGVKGYPTLKYGDPNNLQEYEGEREFEDLLNFAEENLGPTCGPDNMDLCDEEKKEKIEKIMSKGLKTLEAEILELDDILTEAIDNYEKESETLIVSYEDLMEARDNVIAEVEKKDLQLMKVVRAYLKDEEAKQD